MTIKTLFFLIFALGCISAYTPSVTPNNSYYNQTLSLGFKRIIITQWNLTADGALELELQNNLGRDARITLINVKSENENVDSITDITFYQSAKVSHKIIGLDSRQKGEWYWLYVEVTYQDLKTKETKHEEGNIAGVVK